MGRRVHKLPTIPVHESLQRECISKPGMEDIVAKAYEDGQLPSCYTGHPVAIKNSFRSIPGAIYLDGLPTTKRDGVLCVTVVNLLTGTRHFTTLLKNLKCVGVGVGVGVHFMRCLLI